MGTAIIADFSRAVLIDRLASGKMQSEALTRPYKRLYFDNVSSNQQIADMFGITEHFIGLRYLVRL